MEIYRIVNRETDEEIGVYMPPTARDEYNFSSISAARYSNCHGIYKDKVAYKIRKYKLVLVDDDCDPPTNEDYEKHRVAKEIDDRFKELVKEKLIIKARERKDESIEKIELSDQIEAYANMIDAIEAYAIAFSELQDELSQKESIKDCSTCKNNVDFPPPHTCDICTSLDQDEEYGMWEAKE